MLTSQQRGERTDEHPFKSLFQNWDRLFVLGDRSRYINGQRAEISNYLCPTPLTPLRPLRLGVRKGFGGVFYLWTFFGPYPRDSAIMSRDQIVKDKDLPPDFLNHGVSQQMNNVIYRNEERIHSKG